MHHYHRRVTAHRLASYRLLLSYAVMIEYVLQTNHLSSIVSSSDKVEWVGDGDRLTLDLPSSTEYVLWHPCFQMRTSQQMVLGSSLP